MHREFWRDYISLEEFPNLVLGLPDPSDEHVARAALTVAGRIVTFNLSDFPEAALKPYGLAAVTPDVALLSLTETETERVIECVKTIRARLNSPPISAADYVDGLTRAGCPEFAVWLKGHLEKI